jgi:hypothetical protein
VYLFFPLDKPCEMSHNYQTVKQFPHYHVTPHRLDRECITRIDDRIMGLPSTYARVSSNGWPSLIFRLQGRKAAASFYCTSTRFKSFNIQYAKTQRHTVAIKRRFTQKYKNTNIKHYTILILYHKVLFLRLFIRLFIFVPSRSPISDSEIGAVVLELGFELEWCTERNLVLPKSCPSTFLRILDTP